ncbi:MAG TPA: chemoreceptor glutamine deamidase CheD [Acidiferrobacteraceae bacterium]|nr:chemoreceptor glutamine deamidase CheD [Acidiferrobacteraceae bacterium]
MLDSAPDKRLPPAFEVLPGLAHIKRYWDPHTQYYTAKLLPGEYYVTEHDEQLVTVLGSCISACIRDVSTGVGGMNHFMLPKNSITGGDDWQDSRVSASARYGNVAMERLINMILSHGGRREKLEVKVFGGGKILASLTDVGNMNIKFVYGYISSEGLRLAAEDVGDIFPRKVRYYPKTGKVQIKKLRSMHNNTIVSREKSYMDTIDTMPVVGEVDLF